MKKRFYYPLMFLVSFSYAQNEKPPKDPELDPSWKNCIIQQDDSNFFVGGRYSIGSPFTNSYMSVVNYNISDNSSLTASQEFSLNAGAPEVFAVERYYKFSAPIIYRYVGGRFSRYGETVVNGFMRVRTDGSLDPSFVLNNNSSSATVRSIALQADDKIVLGGKFNSYFGEPRGSVVRLNTNGTLDESFATTGTGFNGEVYCVKVQSDGKILVGGDFETYDGVPVPKIARLNSDGSLDATFELDSSIENISKKVRTILIQENGRIIIGGDFVMTICTLRQFPTLECIDSYGKSCIAGLNTDGSLDYTFMPANEFGGAFGFYKPRTVEGVITNVADVFTLSQYPEGKIFVGGYFDSYITTPSLIPRKNMCLLKADGSLSSAFNTDLGGPDLTVRGSKVEENGNVVIVGVFRNFNDLDVNGIVRVDPSGLPVEIANGRMSNGITTESASVKSFKSAIEDKTISITPNPAQDFIVISSVNNHTITGISITDINGRTVKNQTFDNLSTIEMNVSDLAKGMYIMNITSKDGNAIQKFMKN